MDVFLEYEEIMDKMAELGFSHAKNCPTAISIIDQMPYETTIEKPFFGLWRVSFPMAQNYPPDFREDKCPHKAAALAFIAWKKGLET